MSLKRRIATVLGCAPAAGLSNVDSAACILCTLLLGEIAMGLDSATAFGGKSLN